MRVATRRLRAVLEIFAAVLPARRAPRGPARGQGARRRARRAPRPRRPARGARRRSPRARRCRPPGVDACSTQLRAEQARATSGSPPRSTRRARATCAGACARSRGGVGMKARSVKGLDPDGPLADNAERIVATRARRAVGRSRRRRCDPAEVEALHDMRIAAKRLRYVLEVTATCFGPYAGEARQARQGAAGPARRDPRLRRAAARGSTTCAERVRERTPRACRRTAWRARRRTPAPTAGSSAGVELRRAGRRCSATSCAWPDLERAASRAAAIALLRARPAVNAACLTDGAAYVNHTMRADAGAERRGSATRRRDVELDARPDLSSTPSSTSTASSRGSTSTTACSQLAEDDGVPAARARRSSPRSTRRTSTSSS